MKRLALVVLFACSKSEKAPPPAQKLDVSVVYDGKPLAIDRAFMRRPSPDVFTIVLGAKKGSCTEDGTLGFNVTKQVAPIGHESFVVTDLWSRELDLKLTQKVKVKLEGTKLGIPAIIEGKLAINGNAELVDCGAQPPTGIGVPKAPHMSKGRITIAGKELAIKGATVQTRPGVAATDLPDITLSTNVKDCSKTLLPAPVILERVDTKWTLRGTWFPEPIAETDAKGLVFNANSVGTSADGPTLQLQLEGSGKFGDYTVKIEHEVEAIECVR